MTWRYIRDAIHGEIRLREGEYELLETVEMQRLGRLRQLHLVHHVFPAATHTRLAHSLGTLHMLDRILSRSRERLLLNDDEIRYVRFAALLHDVAHPCFGHILEEGLEGQLLDHKDITARVLRGDSHGIWDRAEAMGLTGRRIYDDSVNDDSDREHVSDVLKDDAEPVIRILEEREPGLSELISGTIDADTLDYIQRDAYFCGHRSFAFDDAITSGFAFDNPHGERELVFRDNPIVLNAVVEVIRARWSLFRHVYLHHAVLAADAMLTRAARLGIGSDCHKYLYVLGDDEFLFLLSTGAEGLVGNKKDMPDMDSPGGPRDMATRLLHRKLFKRAYRARLPRLKGEGHALARKASERQIAEEELSADVGMPVVIGAPRRSPKKEYASLRIEPNTALGEALRQHGLSGYLDQYDRLYDDMEQLFVFAASSDQRSLHRLEERCVARFGLPSEHKIGERESPQPLALHAVERLVDDLRRRRPRCVEILNLIAKGRGLTVDELTEKTDRTASTIRRDIQEIRKRQDALGVLLLDRAQAPSVGPGNPGHMWTIATSELTDLVMHVTGGELGRRRSVE